MSLNVVPFKSLGAVSYSTYVVIMAVSVAVCDTFNVKEWPDLETGLGFVQGMGSFKVIEKGAVR